MVTSLPKWRLQMALMTAGQSAIGQLQDWDGQWCLSNTTDMIRALAWWSQPAKHVMLILVKLLRHPAKLQEKRLDLKQLVQ